MGKQHVLRGHGLFRLVWVRGEKVNGRFLRAAYLINPSVSHGIRYGVSVPKRIGSAVRRNRIKRLMREAARRQYRRLHESSVAASAGVDIVFQFSRSIPISPEKKLSLHDIDPDMETICTRIIDKLSKRKV